MTNAQHDSLLAELKHLRRDVHYNAQQLATTLTYICVLLPLGLLLILLFISLI